MIDTIVFDFGGVLIDWNPRYVYQHIFDDETEMEWFLSHVCTNEWNLEQDRGRPFAEGIALLSESFPEHSSHIEAYHSQWQRMLNGEIAGTVKILKQLRKTHNLYGLTNWSAETFPIALDKFDFLQLFDGIVVSGTEKMIKPNKNFFQLLLDRYALTAENCVFIDDNRANIDAAMELGFHTVHFKSPDQLASALAAFGLLNPSNLGGPII